MIVWLLVTVTLACLAAFLQDAAPGALLATTVYKAHLMTLGGWGGYWLDRGLFPYDRPHLYLSDDASNDGDDGPAFGAGDAAGMLVASSSTFGQAMLRRAIVVAACLVCVGLGA